MKFTVALLLVLAVCSAEERQYRSKEKNEKTEKRALIEGNVQKRAPQLLIQNASPSPGIEYAEGKQVNTQTQIYATPVPQVAKISDVLTGQGPAFPAAIASHLYSPIPIYQARLSSPTTYEVSAPVASQLAYSEHKISYQPQQNAIQFTPQTYNQKLQNPKNAIARLTVNYQQQYPQQQQVYIPPQPQAQQVIYQPQSQNLQPAYQTAQTYQAPVPYNQNQVQQPVQYQGPATFSQNNAQTPLQYQGPQTFTQNQVQQPLQYQGPQTFSQNQYQQPLYVPQEQLVQVVQPVQGFTFARQVQAPENHQRPIQRDLKNEQASIKANNNVVGQQQNFNQHQGAVSFASFSLSQPRTPHHPQQVIQPQPNHQVQHHQYQQQVQYQQQPPTQPQAQPAQGKLVAQVSNAPTKPLPPKLSFFHQGPVLPAYQPQVFPPQVYTQGQEVLIQNSGYLAPQTLNPQPLSSQPAQLSPTFQPVQYFGKFAQSIFGGYPQ